MKLKVEVVSRDKASCECQLKVRVELTSINLDKDRECGRISKPERVRATPKYKWCAAIVASEIDPDKSVYP